MLFCIPVLYKLFHIVFGNAYLAMPPQNNEVLLTKVAWKASHHFHPDDEGVIIGMQVTLKLSSFLNELELVF
jgi:hypothetical protein